MVARCGSLFVLCLAVAWAAGEPQVTSKDGVFPSKNFPWKKDLIDARGAALKAEVEKAIALPADQVRAHPAAADFPGLPPADAPRISQAITVDATIAGWHSTGLYAAPGEVITVKAPAAAAKAKVRVRIGAHRDQFWKKDNWIRVPQITRDAPLVGEVTKVASPFGGLIYLDLPSTAGPETWKVEIAGGIPSPRYVLGETTLAQWKKSRTLPGHWAELECKGLIMTVPSTWVRTLEDPETAMKFWDAVVVAQDDLAQVKKRRWPERIVFDRQISGGMLHSGYPIMGHISDYDIGTRAHKELLGTLAELKQGNWGVFHELGHNHQNYDWTFDGTVEVTVNLFSMYCFQTNCEKDRHGHGDMVAGRRIPRMKKYLAAGTFEDWKKDPFLALTMYDQMVEEFGWEPFKKVFAEYRDLPAKERPKGDQDKRDEWLIRFSRTVGRNMGPFFESWKLPTTQAARDAVKDLPVWMPKS